MATFYVATAGNGGSDSHNGSSGSPWASLYHACQNTTNGDTITIGAGTFTETSQCLLPVGVSIIGAGNTSIIKSTYTGSYASGLLNISSTAGTPVNGNQIICYVLFDGNSLSNACAISSNYRYNVTIHDCTIQNFNSRGISFDNGGDFLNAPTYFSNNNVVHDCTITNCGYNDAIDEYACVWFYGQTNLQIYNNTFTNTAQSSNSDILKGAWHSDTKIYGNTFTKPDGDNGGQWNMYTEIFFTTGGMEVYGNTFNGNASLDIVDVRLGADSYGCKIYNNQFSIPSGQQAYGSKGVQTIDFEEWGSVVGVYVFDNHFKNVACGIQLDPVGQSNPLNVGGQVVFQYIYIYFNLLWF